LWVQATQDRKGGGMNAKEIRIALLWLGIGLAHAATRCERYAKVDALRATLDAKKGNETT